MRRQVIAQLNLSALIDGKNPQEAANFIKDLILQEELEAMAKGFSNLKFSYRPSKTYDPDYSGLSGAGEIMLLGSRKKKE